MLTVLEDQPSVRVAGPFLQMSLTCLVMPRKHALERQKPRARCRSIRRLESANGFETVSHRSLLATVPVSREKILVISANVSKDGSSNRSLVFGRTFAMMLSSFLSASFSRVRSRPNTDGSHGRTECTVFRGSASGLDPAT
jgi:hypothetical protein